MPNLPRISSKNSPSRNRPRILATSPPLRPSGAERVSPLLSPPNRLISSDPKTAEQQDPPVQPINPIIIRATLSAKNVIQYAIDNLTPDQQSTLEYEMRRKLGGLKFLSHTELVERKNNDDTYTPMRLQKIVHKTTRAVLWDDISKENLL